MFSQALDIIIHLDQHLNHWVHVFGPWIYAIAFIIILGETGFIIAPFLPGDSLIFALGAMTSPERGMLNLPILGVLLCAAAVCGGLVNYALGAWVGPKIFLKEKSLWFNRAHLIRTHEFYERHGGKAVVLARFVPIIRTFVPFVAGIGKMRYSRFFAFNVLGAVLWVGLILSAGHFFGNLPYIRQHFGLVVPLIVFVSIIPILWKMIADWIQKRRPPKVSVDS